jgi:hypothetical protein
MDKPYYPYPGIGSVEALAKALDIHQDLLIDIASKVDHSYTSFLIPKKNTENVFRTVAEPKHELKRIQKKIISRILELVEYPSYLQGGIKDDLNSRDYINNSSIHVKPEILINLDIKNFYPNIKSNYVLDIFKNFCKFEPAVAEVLTKLVTLNGKVPQGGYCSSYMANLIFYAEEYKLVQKLRKKGWRYSRLLDDITLSSLVHIDDHVSPIKEIAALFRKYDLKLNKKKTDVSHRIKGISSLLVTGVWIGHGVPKVKRHERRYIRQLVYVCEQKHKDGAHSEEYHAFWNQVSGKVAKLTRLNHPEAPCLRKRLKFILPVFDEHERNSLVREVKVLCSKKTQPERIGFIKRINQAFYSIGILSRTEKGLAKSLRNELTEAHGNIPTLKEYWS